MTRLFKRFVAAVVLSLSLFAVPASAQATRTWVSGVGDDANPCSRTAPCKTLAGAISKTAAAGEINILDPAGIGSVTITKSITIQGEGTLGSILASGTNGIIINAATTDRVVIQNIEIEGFGGSCVSGIKILSANQVSVINTTIRACQNGIEVANTNDLMMTIDQSEFIDNTGYGINYTTSVGRSRAWVTRNVFAFNDLAHVRMNGPQQKMSIDDNKFAGPSGTFVLNNNAQLTSYGNNLFDDVPPTGYQLKQQN